MLCQDVLKLRPLRGKAGVGNIPRDQDGIERLLRVDFIEPRQRPYQAIIAARARPAAFDAKSVSSTHHVDVRQVGDTPNAIVRSAVFRGKHVRPIEIAGM